MEQRTTDLILATRTALNQASALAVQYSFSLLGALVLLIIGWMLAGFFHRWAYRGLSSIHGIDETLARFFSNIIRYALLLLVFVTVLGQFGVQTASIIAALGAAGLAVGLALQGTLQNIAAGIMLLVLRPFRVGEYIETSAVSGIVEVIGLFATELRTVDGLYRLAPNSTLWNTPVTNYSRERSRRHDITIKLAMSDDIADAEKRLLRLLDGVPHIERTPAPETFISELGDSSLTLTLRYWIETGQWAPTTRAMLRAVKNEFHQQPSTGTEP